jgi:molecular chaperone HscB
MEGSFSPCWQCSQPVGGLICPACGALQKPPAGFYSFFGIDETLSLDLADLQTRFYDLSRKLHPDRYGRKPPREQQYSVEATSILNDGYRTLRDPVKRAEYVLKQHGFDIGEQRSKDVPPELLEEVFELNMALEEMRGGDESVRPQLEQAREHFSDLLAAVDATLQQQFQQFDSTNDQAVLGAIRGTLNRRRYIQNLVNEVEKELVVAKL